METDRNDDELDRLFTAAREAKLYDPQREYGFESRVMATIRARREDQTPFLVWAWRLIPFFISIVVLLGIWARTSESPFTTDLSAVAKIGNEDAMMTAFLTGE